MTKFAVTAFSTILVLSPIQSACIDQRHNLYVLYDSKDRVWCGYRDEAQARDQVEAMVALEVASIKYVDSAPTSVELTVEDDPGAGDWSITDSYKLDEVGRVKSLRRITRYLPTHVRRTEIFTRRGPGLIRTSITNVSLDTGHSIETNNEPLPTIPTVSTLAGFPFAPVLDGMQREVTQSKFCAAAPSFFE